MAKTQLPADIFYSSISTINQHLVKGDFKTRDLIDAYCDRLEELGPKYNALALSLRKDALAQAKDLEGDFKRGRVRSKLQGVPFGAKDLLSVKDKVTTWGAKPYEKQVLPITATVLKNLKSKGAILIGKLSMVELAGGGGYRFPNASLQGPGLNPWNRDHWSGGSSSGSGSAVSAGLVPFALGSETSGSILTPAAFCGVTGLRPTYGLVSRHGAMALSWTMDKIGPLARSAEDCGLVLEAIAGADGQDPGSAGKGFKFAPEFQLKPSEVRMAWAPVDFDEWASEEIRATLKAALDVFRSLRIQFQEKKLPDFPYGLLTGTIIGAEGAAIFDKLIESGDVDQLADKNQAAGLKASLDISARDYLKAMRIRRSVLEAFRTDFTYTDVIIAPTRLGLASKVDAPLDGGGGPNRTPPKDRGFSGIIGATNLTGWPALTLPCGIVNGLPVGIQLVGKPWHENLLLALGLEFQKLTKHHLERPPAVS